MQKKTRRRSSKQGKFVKGSLMVGIVLMSLFQWQGLCLLNLAFIIAYWRVVIFDVEENYETFMNDIPCIG